MKKQTAVEYLESKIFGDEIFSLSKVFEQAKEMEKKNQDNFAIEFTYYLSDWHTKKRVKELLEIYKNDTTRKV